MAINLNGKTKARTRKIHDRIAHKLRKKATTESMLDLVDLRQRIECQYNRRALVNKQKDDRRRYLVIKGIA